MERDLPRDGLWCPRVLAAVVRSLDMGLFRIGGEESADEHETWVATLPKDHVSIRDGPMVFAYKAKSSIERVVEGPRRFGAAE